MKFDLIRPCKHCPFRSDIDGFLTGDRAEEIADSVYGLGQTFSCHETTEFDDDGEHTPVPSEQHCAGAMIWLEHLDQPNQMMRIAERTGGYDKNKLDMEAPVFDDWFTFVEHHDN